MKTDTKLAQNTRAATILQLCLYTDLLATLQGSLPEKMYVVKPGDNFPTEEYRFAEFHTYYRLVKKNFEQVMAESALPTYPDPVEHCNICRWWQVCDKLIGSIFPENLIIENGEYQTVKENEVVLALRGFEADFKTKNPTAKSGFPILCRRRDSNPHTR